MAELFKSIGTVLDTYFVEPGNPVHNSATSRVVFARNVRTKKQTQVALKYMVNKEEFLRELKARDGPLLGESGLVVEVLACHIPAELSISSEDFKLSNKVIKDKPTLDGDGYPYLIVMERAGESLQQVLSSQRVAGYNIEEVSKLAHALALQLKRLHENCKIVHFDVKARNILLLHADVKRVLLCDMDASAPVGATRVRTEKLGSGAYAAPEVSY